MKSLSLSLGLLSIATLLPVLNPLTPSAQAQCIVTDTNLQVAINGSRKPTDRSNKVTQNVNGACVGNSVNTRNVQVDVGGTSRASQHREAKVTINGDRGNRTGVNIPPTIVNTNIQMDVDNAADRLRRQR
jgi:hypothetical protein